MQVQNVANLQSISQRYEKKFIVCKFTLIFRQLFLEFFHRLNMYGNKSLFAILFFEF